MKTTGGTDKLIRSLNQLQRTHLEVGVVDKVERKQGRGTVTNAGLLYTLDQGETKNGKQWEVLAPGVRDAKRRERVKVAMIDAAKGRGAVGLHRVGGVMSLKVKSNIQGIKSPSLEPSTIARKGHSNPLIDTGQMKDAVGYKLSKK